MTDGGRDAGNGSMSSDPVVELAELAEEASAGFAGRVQRSILRRGLAADLADYVWFSPFQVLLEYLGALFSMVGGRQDKGRR